jgi:hypothetical protein
MATTEAPIHENIKKALVKGSQKDTMFVMRYRPSSIISVVDFQLKHSSHANRTHLVIAPIRSVGNTERVYKNKIAMEVAAIEKKTPVFA